MTQEISISNVEEFDNDDSIDKAIELLQELKKAKHSPAFVLTTSSIKKPQPLLKVSLADAVSTN